MSGMLGAIAIASVKATRQAESAGAGAAGGSAFSPSGVVGGSTAADGASTGRGRGRGTFTFAAAKWVWPPQANSRAATVTMAARRARPLREAHLRRPFPALDFMSNRAKEPRKAIEHSGGTSLCWD